MGEDYEGLVTRALAFGIDAAIVSGVAAVVGALFAATLSVLSVPSDVKNVMLALSGIVFLLWSAAYFVTFWSTTGQTPGNRVLGIQVCRSDNGAALQPSRALLRLVALTLAVIPLFAGFLPILFDDRRRGLHDMIAGTVVINREDADQPTDEHLFVQVQAQRTSRPS